MSARPVVKTSHMSVDMQEAAIAVAQEAIKDLVTEHVRGENMDCRGDWLEKSFTNGTDGDVQQQIASAIKNAFEERYPSV